jgi:hypothetical protein
MMRPFAMKPSLLGVGASGRRPRSASRQRPSPRISLHIEQIVLDGFGAANSGRIRDALQQSLTASLRDSGQRTGRPFFEHDVQFEKAGSALDLRPGANSREIGECLGKAVAQALQRTSRQTQSRSGHLAGDLTRHDISRQSRERR